MPPIIDNRSIGQQVYLADETVVHDRGNPLNDFLRSINQMIIFDPSVFDLTLGGDVLNQILQISTRLVTAQNPGVFRFFINPTVLNQGISKIVTPVLEAKGWETLQWPETPNQMISMQFQGTTGTIIPIKQMRDLGVRDTKYSLNWLRFQQFQQFILQVTNDVKMLYDGKLYEGPIMNLNFTEDANQPFGINYSFQFMAYPDRIRNVAAPNTLFNALPLASTIAASGVSF